MSDNLALSNLSLASSSYRNLSEEDQRKVREYKEEREARSLAVEKAYVHDVYDQISGNFTDSRYRPWPRVKQFLTDLEPGSFVCDVGCGSGKYLSCNPLIYNIGADRCKNLTEIAREKENEVLICDNLALPYKDDSFDAVVSIAVIHHIATTERRVRAIRELARILRVGGRIIISVWSMEQRHRRFESQDVLIPWHRPAQPSSAEENRDTTTTTCTSEEDVTHYHAYTQTGTSDSEPPSSAVSRLSGRRRGRTRHKGRSISPHSSDLSSPNETCYSFVRKAIQRLSTTKRQSGSGRVPWFLTNLESYYAKEMEAWQLARLNKNDSADSNEPGDDLPIEIRHLEDSEDMLYIPPLFSSLIGGTTLTSGHEDQLSKSKSLNDITKLSPLTVPRKMKDQGRSNTCDDPTVPCADRRFKREAKSTKLREENQAEAGLLSDWQSVEKTECPGSGSTSWLTGAFFERPHLGSLSSLSSAKSAVSAMSIKSDSGVGQAKKSLSKLGKFDVKTKRSWCSESQLEWPGAGEGKPRLGARSLNTLLKPAEKEKTVSWCQAELSTMGSIKEVNESDISEANSPNPTPRLKDQRPALVKQKHSIQEKEKFSSLYISLKAFNFPDEKAVAQHHFKELGRELNTSQENKREETRLEQNKTTQIEIEVTEVIIREKERTNEKCIKKQVSLNDELFFIERQKEREKIKEKVRRQQSLPECHFSSEERPRSLKDSFLAVTQRKKFDIFLEGITKLRKSAVTRTEERPAVPQSEVGDEKGERRSLKVGISKMLNKWKSEAEEETGLKSFTQKRGVTIDPINVLGLRRDQSLDSATRRGLYHRAGGCSPKSPQQQISPTVRRCCMECPEELTQSQERRLSQGGSDSSKDSSIQSDTSLDSEDSCVSVIFVAKPGVPNTGHSQRSTSNSSGSSESPPGRGSPGSPGNKTVSPVKIYRENPCSTNQAQITTSSEADLNKEEERLSSPLSPKVQEHKSFEMEDLPDDNPINCHPRAYATRVEYELEPPLSPLARSDYPIVRHHPLFAKSHRSLGGGASISSLLVGENVEYIRKPGVSLSKSVQSVRKSSPKLLTFEIFNPETDDLDSDNNESSLSSSPDSEESVISVINDVRNTEQSTKEAGESENAEAVKRSGEENFIFKFDIESIPKEDKFPKTDFCFETKRSIDSQDKILSDLKSLLEIDEIEKEIERKAEERKKILISLLDENKTVLQNMKAKGSLTKSDTIEEVALKTSSQLQSMEELRLPSVLRSHSISPETREGQECCRSEPILHPLGLGSSQESLKDVEDLECQGGSKKEAKRRKISSMEKLKQISGAVQAEGDEALVPIEICVTEHINEKSAEKSQGSAQVSSEPVPLKVKDDQQQTRNEESFAKKQKDLNKITKVSEESKEDKTADTLNRPTEMDSAIIIPYRKLERKKRDDSLESNTASVKSSVQLSDSGSLLSHRFSTISISSNVSSDVSLGNTSGVSGSSCYLASMSSADFDDRPPLASSFSLSEAEETKEVEEILEQSSLRSTSSIKKKEQLSPPKTGVSSGERPKLKSLFKRSSNGTKSGGSNESRSHESWKEENGKQNRSRIGTFSSLTPDTSLEQATCVERSSTSVEEELFRSAGSELITADVEEDAVSASDSEDSAETGGSLTHHRYYHVFREGEIDHIIEKYVENLHIISSYYDHANWCIIAEKVNVWTL